MKNYCTYTIDKKQLDNDINMFLSIANHYEYNKMLMNTDTVRLLTGKSFFEVRKQKYREIEIIEDASLKPGEIVFLAEWHVLPEKFFDL